MAEKMLRQLCQSPKESSIKIIEWDEVSINYSITEYALFRASL